jgi:hypothetical protein
MNRSLYIFILALFLASSCKKESLLTYNANDNIYFNYIANADPATNYLGIHVDSLNISFAFSSNALQDTIVRIPVAVTGVAKDYDRSYSVTADPSSTAVATTNYELPANFTLRAGKILDSVAVKFKRTADLKTKELSLMLRLNENDQFKTQTKFRSRQIYYSSFIENTDTVRTLTFKMVISDKLVEGPYWGDYSYYLGEFSEKKVRLINQMIGMPLNFWSVPNNTPEHRSDLTYYGGFMFRYLADQAFAGNIILDEDGMPMTMGSYYQ